MSKEIMVNFQTHFTLTAGFNFIITHLSILISCSDGRHEGSGSECLRDVDSSVTLSEARCVQVPVHIDCYNRGGCLWGSSSIFSQHSQLHTKQSFTLMSIA